MITLDQNLITINNWTIHNPDIVNFVSQLQKDGRASTDQEIEDVLEKALRIGIIALEQTQTQVDVNAIRREFERMHWQLQFTLDHIFKEDDGKMILVFDRYLGQGGRLEDLFDPNRRTSAVGRIQAIFDEHFNGNSARFTQLLDYTTENSPLRKLHLELDKKFGELNKHIIELREQLAQEKGRAEEYQRGAHKGFEFEEIVQELLEPTARIFKDQVTYVGGEAVGQCRKGDLLVELCPEDTLGQSGVSIILECKTQSRPVTGKTGILKELEDAMNVRNARFGIAVFGDGTGPSTAGRLRLYSGNRIVCSISRDGSDAFILEGAYQIARAELCRQARHSSGEIDHAAVNEAIKQVEEKLSQFQGLKRKVTDLSSLAGEIRQQLDNIEHDIRTELNNISTVLIPAEEIKAV